MKAQRSKCIEIESPVTKDMPKGEEQVYVTVPATELTYTPPPTDWETTPAGTVKYLGDTKPQACGSYDVKKLEKDKTYDVFFWVAMSDHYVQNPVNVKLQIDDKVIEEHNINVTLYSNQWTAVPVGEFKNIYEDGEIIFTFTGNLGENSWNGLLFSGVAIDLKGT